MIPSLHLLLAIVISTIAVKMFGKIFFYFHFVLNVFYLWFWILPSGINLIIVFSFFFLSKKTKDQKMDPMTIVTQYNLLQNGPPEESKLATYMVCIYTFYFIIIGFWVITFILF